MKQTRKEMIEVLQGAENGEQIQQRLHCEEGIDDGFYGCNEKPSWDFSRIEYRVKPKPLQCWVLYNNYGRLIHCADREKNKYTGRDDDYILMTEVIK